MRPNLDLLVDVQDLAILANVKCPTFGQAAPFVNDSIGFGHFFTYATTKQEYPINRFTMEVKRQLDVLNRQLQMAILLALILRATGNPMEEVTFLWTPLEYLANALVAFALITLGVQLSKTKPPHPKGSLSYALAIRLLGGPLVAIGLTFLFGFRGEIAAILIVGAAAPTAVNTALLAHEFKADSQFAAAAVFYSTLAASLVVTALLAILRAGWIPWAIP